MSECLCGNPTDYKQCCGRYIDGDDVPATPEQLMRSRYSAYVKGDVDYIEKTMQGRAANGFNPQSTKVWLDTIDWLGLQILKSEMQDDVGQVAFVAQYQQQGQTKSIYEISEFSRHDGRWFYIDGKQPKPGRNDPCLCGSGKKFKKCCG